MNSYLGQVATRCGLYDGGFSAGNVQAMTRSAHIATEPLTQVQIMWPNFNVSSGSEPNLDSATSLELSIEYPADTYKRVTFQGVNVATAAIGVPFYVSDFVFCNIPEGAMFWIRARFTLTGATTNGMPTCTGVLPNWGTGVGDAFEGIILSATTGGTNLVMTKGSGGNSGNNDGFSTNFSNSGRPAAILQFTNQPSVFLAGDSIFASVGDTMDSQFATGWGARAVGNKYGWINAAISGEALASVYNNTNYVQRAKLAKFCSHMLSNYGTNDLPTAPATTLSRYGSFLNNYFAGKPAIIATLVPRTTSTDAFITEVNQTVGANEANRLLFNDGIRLAQVVGRYDHVVDVDQIASSAYLSGKWKVFGTTTNRMTADGTHPTHYGANFIAAQVDLSCIG